MKKAMSAAPLYEAVSFKLGYIDMQFIKLVDSDEFDEWFDEATLPAPENVRIDRSANLYSFIRHFNIPDDTVRKTLAALRTGSENDFSDEEIEELLSEDAEDVAEHFSSDSAIRKGANLYSMNWIYTHSIADYESAGITADDIKIVMPLFEKYGLQPAAETAIKEKLNGYLERVLT